MLRKLKVAVAVTCDGPRFSRKPCTYPDFQKTDNSYIKLCLGLKGRNEADSAFWLATRPGNMGVSFPLGIFRFILQEKILFSLLTYMLYRPILSFKMVFDVFMKVDFVSVHNNRTINKTTQKVAQHLFILAPRLITYMHMSITQLPTAMYYFCKFSARAHLVLP